jgi:hypothetical protein
MLTYVPTSTFTETAGTPLESSLALKDGEKVNPFANKRGLKKLFCLELVYASVAL